MKLKEYTSAEDIAEAIKDKVFTYQYVLNQSSKFTKKFGDEFNIYKEACKLYTCKKKKAVAKLLKEW